MSGISIKLSVASYVLCSIALFIIMYFFMDKDLMDSIFTSLFVFVLPMLVNLLVRKNKKDLRI